MKIKDIILVIDNYKGIERNFLCTFEGFVKNHITNACDNFYEVAEMVKELDATRGKFNEYCEMYFASNKTMYAKYCSSISELQIFLINTLPAHILQRNLLRFHPREVQYSLPHDL